MISGVTEIWIHTRRGIEAVITRRSWKPFVRKGAWVRIPPSPLDFNKQSCGAWLWKESARSGLQSNNVLIGTAHGEVPKRLKGHPWKGCRSLTAARGFKSLLLRSLDKKEWKNSKKCLTSWKQWVIINKCCGIKARHELLKEFKKIKKSCWQTKSTVIKYQSWLKTTAKHLDK